VAAIEYVLKEKKYIFLVQKAQNNNTKIPSSFLLNNVSLFLL